MCCAFINCLIFSNYTEKKKKNKEHIYVDVNGSNQPCAYPHDAFYFHTYGAICSIFSSCIGACAMY